MRKSKFRLLPLFGLALFLVLSGLGFWAMQKQGFNLDFRKQASGEQLSVTLGNSSTKIQPNQAVTVDLMVNTQGKFVSGLQFTGTITGVNQDKSGVVISQITGLNPVFSEVTKVGSDLHFKFVELAAFGSSAFTTHDQSQKIATFNLYPLQSGEVKLTFDQNNSGAMEFGKSFLSSNVGQQKYTVEVTSATATGGNSNAPADAGIHRSCNQYCADSRECATEFSCWYNRCRNPKNIQEEKCTDPVVVKPAPVTPVVKVTTTTTKGTTVATPTPTPAAKTAVATVVITTASSSTRTATPSSRPVQNLNSTSTTTTTKSLANSPSPSPVALANTSQSSSSLGFLIGAAIVTGLLAFGAIIFFLKNRNSR